MTTNRFPKSQRLKSRKKLQEIFTNKKFVRGKHIQIFYYVEIDEVPVVKCGVGVGGKYFKKAVHRNRIKRLLREAYRLQQHPLHLIAGEKKIQLFLFILYTGKELPLYIDIYENVEIALLKLCDVINAANN